MKRILWALVMGSLLALTGAASAQPVGDYPCREVNRFDAEGKTGYIRAWVAGYVAADPHQAVKLNGPHTLSDAFAWILDRCLSRPGSTLAAATAFLVESWGPELTPDKTAVELFQEAGTGEKQRISLEEALDGIPLNVFDLANAEAYEATAGRPSYEANIISHRAFAFTLSDNSGFAYAEVAAALQGLDAYTIGRVSARGTYIVSDLIRVHRVVNQRLLGR